MTWSYFEVQSLKPCLEHKKSQYTAIDGCWKGPESENETGISFNLSNICLSNTGFTLSVFLITSNLNISVDTNSGD